MTLLLTLLLILAVIFFALALFFLGVWLVQLTYNRSIPSMNSSWKKIDYKTALALTLFFALLGVGSSTCYISNNARSKLQFF